MVILWIVFFVINYFVIMALNAQTGQNYSQIQQPHQGDGDFMDTGFIVKKCATCGVTLIPCKTLDGKSTYYKHPYPDCRPYQGYYSPTQAGY